MDPRLMRAAELFIVSLIAQQQMDSPYIYEALAKAASDNNFDITVEGHADGSDPEIAFSPKISQANLI